MPILSPTLDMSSKEKKYTIRRLHQAEHGSLKAWSAADEYLLAHSKTNEIRPNHLYLYNDRFGYLACHLHNLSPTLISNYSSQTIAIEKNLKANNLAVIEITNPLSDFDRKVDYALIKIPKSLALFQLYLEQIIRNSTENLTVVCAFMTRHFSPKMIKIANTYFEDVEQSRAVKKARLIVLKKKKSVSKKELTKVIEYNGRSYEQYWGVFSAMHIDYATQFFLDKMEVLETDKCILDLGSGNGIIANEIHKQFPQREIHLLDDSFLAVASGKLNLQGENIHHHYHHELDIFEDQTFDLIVSNPPFHFEYENNIQVAIKLFKECERCLKTGGNLQVVANKHLNYRTHLSPLFLTVDIIVENSKYVVYKCIKLSVS